MSASGVPGSGVRAKVCCAEMSYGRPLLRYISCHGMLIGTPACLSVVMGALKVREELVYSPNSKLLTSSFTSDPGIMFR